MKTQVPPEIQETPTPDLSAAEVKQPTKPKYDKDELLTIFDEIIFSGEYREDVSIKNKLKVTFRSRSADDINAISKELDSGTYNLISTLQEKTAFLNVVHSVVSYSGKDLAPMNSDAKKAFFGKLPAVVIGAISQALITFDAKVAAACMEGEENF